MTLTQEQIIELKNQLKEQVTHLSPDKKAHALAQIESLSPQALEAMIEQQKERGQSAGGNQKEEKTIFRMIIDKDIKSVTVDENKVALAVLDINPISKAHIIIIPKKSVSDTKDLPSQAFVLANKLAKKVSDKLGASSYTIQPESKFGEVILNVLPSYTTSVNINSPRSKANMDELEQIASKLRPRLKSKIEKIKISKRSGVNTQVLRMSRRVP